MNKFEILFLLSSINLIMFYAERIQVLKSDFRPKSLFYLRADWNFIPL